MEMVVFSAGVRVWDAYVMTLISPSWRLENCPKTILAGVCVDNKWLFIIRIGHNGWCGEISNQFI